MGRSPNTQIGVLPDQLLQPFLPKVGYNEQCSIKFSCSGCQQIDISNGRCSADERGRPERVRICAQMNVCASSTCKDVFKMMEEVASQSMKLSGSDFDLVNVRK